MRLLAMYLVALLMLLHDGLGNIAVRTNLYGAGADGFFASQNIGASACQPLNNYYSQSSFAPQPSTASAPFYSLFLIDAVVYFDSACTNGPIAPGTVDYYCATHSFELQQTSAQTANCNGHSFYYSPGYIRIAAVHLSADAQLAKQFFGWLGPNHNLCETFTTANFIPPGAGNIVLLDASIYKSSLCSGSVVVKGTADWFCAAIGFDSNVTNVNACNNISMYYTKGLIRSLFFEELQAATTTSFSLGIVEYAHTISCEPLKYLISFSDITLDAQIFSDAACTIPVLPGTSQYYCAVTNSCTGTTFYTTGDLRTIPVEPM